jgi:hypothetical protein
MAPFLAAADTKLRTPPLKPPATPFRTHLITRASLVEKQRLWQEFSLLRRVFVEMLEVIVLLEQRRLVEMIVGGETVFPGILGPG